MAPFALVAVVLLVGFLLFRYTRRNLDYWEKRGVTLLKNAGLFQQMFQLATKQKTVFDFDKEAYSLLGSERYGGNVEMGTPGLLIKDTELIKQILVKDFDHFVDRRKVEIHSDPLLNLMLTFLDGQEWKNVRGVMTPTFTTGKIRRMFHHFNKCGADLVEFIKSKPAGSPGSRDVVVKEAFSRYLVDVIGATAFGMETSSLTDPNSIFYRMSNKTTEYSAGKIFKLTMIMMFPFLTRFGLTVSDSEPMTFFSSILKTALKQRESSPEKRDDFLQLLIESRRGELNTEDGELDQFEKNAQLSKSPGGGSGKGKVILSDDMIIAQCILFFLAGLDTTGSLLSFGVYLLAEHQDIQSKLYEDVKAAMKDNNGEIDYDSINRMEYMDKFTAEVLRMYPPGARVERRCTKEYQLPGTGLTLEKDTLVFMSVSAMHHDPKYYPNPEKFDPERFSPEEKAKRNPYTYMPFGQGPRNCIGMRFALMEAKIALAYLVYNFSIEPCENTPFPVKLESGLIVRPSVDLELRFKVRS